MKRILAILFAIVASIGVLFAERVKVKGVYYNIDKNSKTAAVTITNYNEKYKGKIDIPATIKYDNVVYTVTSIGKDAFWSCENLQSITLPETIETIGYRAFGQCSNLSTVTFPSKLRVIEDFAFEQCSSLTSAIIPDSVDSIGDVAFSKCTNLKNVVIGKNVVSIGSGAFFGCNLLHSIVWNARNCSSISPFSGHQCRMDDFKNHSSVYTFEIGSDVERVPAYLCENMYYLSTVMIKGKIPVIEKGMFKYCRFLEKIHTFYHREAITSIGDSAFYHCESLKGLDYLYNVTSIGDYAFNDCKKLSYFYIPESVKTLGKYIFSGCEAMTEISYPNGLIDLSNTGLSNKTKKRTYNRTKPVYFSDYAKLYVQKVINEWQKKDEFESVSEWQQRVNEQTRNAKIKELTAQYEQEYLNMFTKTLKVDLKLGTYNAENKVFLLTDPVFGNLLVPVPSSEGRAFKENWKTAQFTPKYFIENDVPSLSSLDIYFPSLDKHYSYSNQASLHYELAQVDYEFDPIEIEKPTTSSHPKGQQTISVSETKIRAGRSAVDNNIPETGAKNENTFVVIFANENYKNVAPVPFALNDGRVFAKYCQRTLGIPAANIKVYENSTYNDMRLALVWLTNVAKQYQGEASIILYYTGHGIPDEAEKTSYILPVDGDGHFVATGYKLDDLYQRLGEMPTKTTTVLLDACFSGATRDGKTVAQAKAVALKAKPGTPQGNTVVFSAAQGDETAGFNEEEGHGMFTYYILKKLQETKGDITLSDLSQYVIREVGKKSAVSNKPQTPSINAASAVANEWQNWKLK